MELLRDEIHAKHFFRESTGLSVKEFQLRKNIAHLLANTSVTLALSHSCFDLIYNLFCSIIRSSSETYILDICILDQIMAILLFKNKASKEILLLFDDMLKHGSHAVKMRLVEYLSKNKDKLLKLMQTDNISVQVAAITVVLAAQRYNELHTCQNQ